MTSEKQKEKELPIKDQWESSPKYKEYQRLKELWKLKEAEAIKKETILKITKEALKVFVNSYSEKGRSIVEEQVNKLPDDFQTLVADLNIKIKNNLAPWKTQKDINIIDLNIILFARSILYGKWECVKVLNTIMERAPELKGTPLMDYLLEVWWQYDKMAKMDRDIERWKEVIEMLKKY